MTSSGYSYPSGYPYPYSAAILRQQLDAAERKFPLRKRMVVIGHSMGGCITRLLITDTGNKILDAESSRDALMRLGDFCRQPDVRFKPLVIAIDERDKRTRHLKKALSFSSDRIMNRRPSLQYASGVKSSRPVAICDEQPQLQPAFAS